MITDKPIKIFGKKPKDVHMFMKPFLLVINGATGTGKTNLACNIFDIIDHQKGSYDKAWYYSQAGKLDETLNSCINTDDVSIIDTTKELLETLQEFGEEQRERVDEKEKKLTALLIIDDTTGSDFVKAGTRTGKALIDVIKLHRHLKISIIFIQHRVNVINPTIRGIVNYWVVFPVSDEELKLIAENTKLPRDIIFSKFKECINDLHDYIMIDNIKRKIYCNNDKVMFKLVYDQFGTK